MRASLRRFLDGNRAQPHNKTAFLVLPVPSMKATSARIASFGPYTLDLRSGELKKSGYRIKMGEQSFTILAMLLEHPGEMVTREELRAKLWADDTFVDFDHGLNSAVQRVRDCLSDSAGKPRWVETLPRRGYRFVGEVEFDAGAEVDAALERQAVADSNGELSDPSPSGRASRIRRWAVAAAAVTLVLALAAFPVARWLRTKERASRIRSIAVLPLENYSGDPNQDYFADGMTDELITKLARNPALRVISRTTVMQYKRVRRPLPEIARELGVDGVLEGSVGRTGSRVHVTAQLIYARSDTHVWADSYDRDFRDVGSLQEELAQAIAKQVGATTSDSDRHEKTILPVAHDAYLRGRYLWFAGDYVKSQHAFQEAIDAQPDYAAAWSGLADAYTVRAVAGMDPPESVMPQALSAAQKGIELDDSLGEAHNALAAIEMFSLHHFEEAERESARAVELDPRRGESHHLRAYVLTTLNRMDEAVQEEHMASELEPLARPWALGLALLRSHQFDNAVRELTLRSEGQRKDQTVLYFLARAYEYQGMEMKAESVWARLNLLEDNHDKGAAAQRAIQRGGLKAGFVLALEDLKVTATKSYVPPLEFANAHARLRHREETLHWLEESYRQNSPWLVHIQHDPDFDFLHGEPRYRAIVAKMGLPPAF